MVGAPGGGDGKDVWPPHGEGNTPAGLVRLLTDAVRAVAAADGMAEAAAVLAELAVRHLHADLAGVSAFARGGERLRLAASSERIGAIDEISEELPDSPLRAPLPLGTLIHVPDVAADQRWPAWGSAVRALGARTALLAGLPAVHGQPVTLELYGHSQDSATRMDRITVVHFAAHVGLALEQAEQRWNLQEAMHTRGLIGQAQGILMERYRLTGPQAMAYLRRQSQRSQLKVRDLAANIVGDRADEATGEPRLEEER
jgi:hypothetical protein